MCVKNFKTVQVFWDNNFSSKDALYLGNKSSKVYIQDLYSSIIEVKIWKQSKYYNHGINNKQLSKIKFNNL